jgi:hypothetical protein
MKKRGLLFKIICLLMLFGNTARASLIIHPSSGTDTVCTGTMASYFVSPVTGGYYYKWITPLGYPTGTGPTVSVNWTAPGTTTLKLYVLDSTGTDTIANSALVIIVEPTPAPFLTAPESFACQPLYGIQFTDTDKCYNTCAFSGGTYTATDHGLGGGHFGWSATGYSLMVPDGPGTEHITWGAVGAGSLTLIDTSIYGCISTQTYCINILPDPTTSIRAEGFTNPNSITVCDSSTITFIDSSTSPLASPIVTYSWHIDPTGSTFSGGGSSTAPSSVDEPISFQFNYPGTYRVTFVVTDACGCSAQDTMGVTVNPSHVVQISCPGVICEGDTVTYKSEATCGSYSWNIVGGTPITATTLHNVTVKWDHVDTSGFGYINLTTAGCTGFCTAVSTAVVPVMKATGTIEGPAVVCPNSQYVYNLPQWPTTEFNFNIATATDAFLHPYDQPNEVILQTGSDTGLITIKANYVNTLLGCGGLATKTVRVQPQVSISPLPEKLCFNSLDSFYLSGATTGTWKLVYPDMSIHTATGPHAGFIFSETGTYQLSVSGSFCAPDAVTIVVDPKLSRPDSISGPDTVCRGVPVTYTGKNPTAGTIFGWGAINGTLDASTGGSTDITFNAGTGPYKVELWRISATTPHCHSDTLTKIIDTNIIHINIVSLSGSDTACPSSFVSYYSTYKQAETYNWSIYPTTAGSVSSGDGKDTANILWNNPTGTGIFADLIVKERKCTGTFVDTQKIWIAGIATAGSMTFSEGAGSIDTVCQGAAFNASLSPIPAGPVIWSFGDGGIDTAIGTVTYAYSHPDSSTISYSVTANYFDACGFPLAVSKTIYVNPSPVVAISTTTSPLIYCDTVGEHATLAATIQGGYGLTTSLAWYQVGCCVVSSCTGGPVFPCSTYVATFHQYYAIATNSNGCSSNSNIMGMTQFCDSSACEGTDPPLCNIDAVTVTCNHVHMHGYFTSPAYTAGWVPPTGAYNVVSTPNDLNFDIGAAGNYLVGYIESYTSDSGICSHKIEAWALVPLIPGLKNSITCGAGSNYTVKLLDHSDYYPGCTYTDQYQIGTGPLVGFGPSYVTSLSGPGTYYVHNYVTWTMPGAGSGTCEATDTIVLPNKPLAEFAFARDTTCIIDTSVAFSSVASTGAGLTFQWKFGDGATNSQPDPFRVYSSVPAFTGTFQDTLIVTDEYGCSSTKIRSIPVIADNIGGNLTTSSPGCAGGSVTITDNFLAGGTFGEHYKWYNNLTPFAITTAHIENVFSAGSYWAIVTNHYGCKSNRAAKPVIFAVPPPGFITGDTSACEGVDYKLTAYGSGDSGIIYTWLKNGVEAATGPEDYIINNDAAGTYNYKLVTAVLNGSGSYCTDTSANFRVTVFPGASPLTLGYSIINCSSYQIHFTASDPDGGSSLQYAWSGGVAGTSFIETHGGLWTCTYTNPHGCIAHATLDVPVNPNAYLWMFPTGCVSICSSTLPREITGPTAASIDNWSWIKNGTAASTGTGPVAPYSVTSTGKYQLGIGNDYCNDTSGVLNFTAGAPCVKCTNSMSVAVTGVTHTTTGGGCKDTLIIKFTNGLGALTYDITANDGMLLPASGSAPAGVSTVKFRYVEDVDSDITADTSVLLTVVVHLPTGDCIDTVRFKIHPCDNSFAPRLANGGNDGTESEPGTITEGLLASLQIVPNPANNSTNVYYDFAGEGTSKYIEVYDISGRLINRHEVSDEKGKWLIPLDSYTAGLYVIVMREDGRALLQSKLSVVR